MKKKYLLFLCLFHFGNALANAIFIPMDNAQANHLKAYGLAYWELKNNHQLYWLLNYQGGSFLMDYSKELETECSMRGVSYEVISDASRTTLLNYLADPDLNVDAVKLQKPAKIAVYSPIKISQATFEDTDAVLLALRYAEIPFEVVYDEEIMRGELLKYDWLHLHHEDFTGQFGKDVRRMSYKEKT